ncbi:hypothetical protein DFH11DRAFT_1548407 [Phellopilus nigrolimitatus]|nr:hypothetical protein DFH11DRAFT_1548407 [Phellopilus nigrolimitatus]
MLAVITICFSLLAAIEIRPVMAQTFGLVCQGNAGYPDVIFTVATLSVSRTFVMESVIFFITTLPATPVKGPSAEQLLVALGPPTSVLAKPVYSATSIRMRPPTTAVWDVTPMATMDRTILLNQGPIGALMVYRTAATDKLLDNFMPIRCTTLMASVSMPVSLVNSMVGYQGNVRGPLGQAIAAHGAQACPTGNAANIYRFRSTPATPSCPARGHRRAVDDSSSSNSTNTLPFQILFRNVTAESGRVVTVPYRHDEADAVENLLAVGQPIWTHDDDGNGIAEKIVTSSLME